MAKENPEGRRLRPGLIREYVEQILDRIWQTILAIQRDTTTRRIYVNIGATISLAWEKAVRLGELCRGEEWDSHIHLSRMTIRAALDAGTIRRSECILIQPPRRMRLVAKQVPHARKPCTQTCTIRR